MMSRPPGTKVMGGGGHALTSPDGGTVTCPVCTPGFLAPGITDYTLQPRHMWAVPNAPVPISRDVPPCQDF